MSDLEIVLNNDEAVARIRGMVDEAVGCLKIIDQQKEQIKEIAQVVKEEFSISSKDFNAIVKHTYNDEIDEELEYLGLIEFAVKKIGTVDDDSDL